MFDNIFSNVPVSISVWLVVRLRFHKWHFTEFSYCKALREGDRERRLKFCEIIFGKMEVEDNFFSHLVLSDEATFHLNGMEWEFNLNGNSIKYP